MTGPQDSAGFGAPWQQPTQPTGPVPTGPQWSPGPAPGSPGFGYAPAYELQGEPVLVVIGDISVTRTRVFTPSGIKPLNEVSWTITDGSVTTNGIPTWAIICAIIGLFFFLLGLLFLLVKETRTSGAMQVTVYGPGFVHTAHIPVTSQAQVIDINARVNHARMVAGAFGAQQPGVTGQPQPGIADSQQPGLATPPSGFAMPQQPGVVPQPGFAGQPQADQAPSPWPGVGGRPADATGQEPTRGR